MEGESPWWGVLRFQCQCTGACCTARGDYGFVYLRSEDASRLARFIGISVEEFEARACARTDGYLHLQDPEKDCTFLRAGKCAVYEARPTQCRSWPFWEENLASADSWASVARECAGIGKGQAVGLVELGRRLKDAREHDRSLDQERADYLHNKENS